MIKRLSLLVAVLGAVLAPSLASAVEQEARVIVRFKPQADSVRAKPMARRMGAYEVNDIAQTRATALGLRLGRELRAGLALDERTQVMTAKGIDSATLVKRLSQDAEVELVAVDGRRKHTLAPNDTLYAAGNGALPAVGQWYLRAPTAEIVSSINATAAWDITTGSSSVIVAVLDTGIRKDHPDLAAKIVGGYDMIALNSGTAVALATANDGDRADADASDPGDWVTQAEVDSQVLGSSCTSDDVSGSSWHGTRVAGLIAASSNNGEGMAGVGWGVRILPIRVLGKCGGYDSDIMAGMRWAAGIGVPGLPANPNVARVINMSLGGSGACGTTGTGALYRDTINQVVATGATVVVAAGNSTGQAVGLPGNCPGVITVAGLRHAGSKVGFSSLGPEVTIAAPGGNCVNVGAGEPCLYPMVSTTNAGAQGPTTNTYTFGSASVGTSFSAPLVSGTVALMLSARPSLTSTEIKAMLQSTARPFVSTGATAGTLQCAAPTGAEQLECYCTTSTCGAGMLDARAVVAAAQAANGGQVQIAVSASPTAGQTVTVSETATLGTGRTVAGIAWSIVDGGGVVSGFASGANQASATFVPTGAGTVVVRVTVTDDLGSTYAANSTVTVAAASTTPTTPPSSGGGGGAFGAGWLALLALAGVALRRRT